MTEEIGRNVSVPVIITCHTQAAKWDRPSLLWSVMRGQYRVRDRRHKPIVCPTGQTGANRSPWKRRHTTLEIDRSTSHRAKRHGFCRTMADHGTIPGNTARNYLYRFAHSGPEEGPAQADPVALPGLLGTD